MNAAWSSRRLADGGEGDGAAGVAGAVDQVVATGGDGGAQRVGDDLQVRDLGFDLGELGLRPGRQTGVGASAVSVASRIEEVGHLVRG